MTANQADYSIQMMSRSLGVSRSGFYAHTCRRPSARAIADAVLASRIEKIHKASKETYGAPRIHAALTEEGTSIGRKRVERLMKANGLRGVSRRKFISTIVRDERVRQAEWSRTHLAPSYNAGESEYAYALQVLADLLGGGSTSRLYRALVIDQKVAVSAGAWYSPTNLYLSQFGLYASPAPGVDLVRLEAAVNTEIAALLDEGVSDDEVTRITARMVRGAIYARESLGTAARIFGAALTSGTSVEDVEAWPARIAAVTATQVIAAARAILIPETSVTGLLLPAGED